MKSVKALTERPADPSVVYTDAASHIGAMAMKQLFNWNYVRVRSIAVLSAVTMMLGLVACSSGSESFEIRIADSYSPKHPFGKYGTAHFIEGLESSGVAVEYYPSGQLGNARDLANMVRENALDIAPASPAYLEDELPLSSVSDLPNMTDDACVAANAMMKLLSPGGTLYEREYKPRMMRPLWVAIIPSYEIMTAQRKVSTPQDLNGLLMRSSGGAFDVTTATLGASPVSMTAADTFEALSRGTVDGTAFPFISAVSYDLGGVAKYSTEGLNVGAVGIPYVIAESTFEKMTDSQQEELRSLSEKTNSTLCEGINEDQTTSKKKLEESGMEFTAITSADRPLWEETMATAKDDWAQSLDAVGRPGSEVLAEYEAAIKEFEGQRKRS